MTFNLRFLSLELFKVYLLWWIMPPLLLIIFLTLDKLHIYLCLYFFLYKKRIKNVNVEIKYDNSYNILYLYEILVVTLTSFYVLGYQEFDLVFKYKFIANIKRDACSRRGHGHDELAISSGIFFFEPQWFQSGCVFLSQKLQGWPWGKSRYLVKVI